MSSPDLLVREPEGELIATRRAMATRVSLRLRLDSAGVGPASDPEAAAEQALDVFSAVDRTCTRFDPTSPLMQVNATPTRWHEVPPELYAAILEAKRAHDATSGRFDPRVLRYLVGLGYVRTLAFGDPDLDVGFVGEPSRASRPGPWRPRLRSGTREVLVGPEPIDLGGIGKGLAVRWAAEKLAHSARDFLIDAGGDCFCSGTGPDGDGWLVGIEDPTSPSDKVAVVALRDLAATTSSVRLRQWRASGRKVHHLIDPSSGEPGGRGLLSVTVVAVDPARAEAWSKALFVAGRTSIAALAQRHSLAALWVSESSGVSWSPAMQRHLRWLC